MDDKSGRHGACKSMQCVQSSKLPIQEVCSRHGAGTEFDKFSTAFVSNLVGDPKQITGHSG